MARRSYRAPSRGRRASGSYRSASPRRNSGGRKTSRKSASGRAQTLRIVIEQPSSSAIARPDLIGKMPVTGLTRTRSRF